MSQTVVLKSNKYGINLILDHSIDFDQLLKDIAAKFEEAASFFKGAKMALSFEGRTLTQEEELRIVDTITSHSQLAIVCIVDNDKLREQMIREAIEQQEEEDAVKTGQFYKGTLRSGQILECEASIIILGDVNPGAKVVCRGNIVVLGSLKGNAYAGAGGNETAFVAALEMDPVQIKIGDVIGRSADKAFWVGRKKKKKAEPVIDPQVAVVKDGNIYIEPITRGLLNNL
ncbi:MAG: septum site-determining protein MinC [Lachnospiraceae bacterium]|jgi:septum site-determining protein MinC|nr:septum site-determining protein MinC [Lachnospiraceae bacterium]